MTELPDETTNPNLDSGSDPGSMKQSDGPSVKRRRWTARQMSRYAAHRKRRTITNGMFELTVAVIIVFGLGGASLTLVGFGQLGAARDKQQDALAQIQAGTAREQCLSRVERSLDAYTASLAHDAADIAGRAADALAVQTTLQLYNVNPVAVQALADAQAAARAETAKAYDALRNQPLSVDSCPKPDTTTTTEVAG